MTLGPGARLGPYEVVGFLGAGGMGEVYRARDTRLGREVALKLLSGRVAAAPGFRERFEREARALSAVEHPHICALFDVGSAGGSDYLVLQYVEGETLAERIRRGPLAVPEAIALARQVAAAVEAAHARGILHRDLKPANIKITPEGQAKILDFGLARSTRADAAPHETSAATAAAEFVTESGVILGSAGYMSPEQTLGGDVDRATDIWAFGCVLYEMLAGRHAFAGATISQVNAAVVGREPDWEALPAHTPAPLRRLLERCLRKDPARRLRDIGDARLELEELEAGGGATAAPAAPAPRVARGPSWLAWGVAALALAAAGAAWWLRGAGSAGDVAEMRFDAVTTFSGVEAQPALSPDGRSVAFVSNRDGRWDLYVGLVSGGQPVRVTDDPNVEMRPRWSPDGSRLLYARLDSTGMYDAWQVPALGGTPRLLVRRAAFPAWSPDGRLIAYCAGGAIWICDANGEHPRRLTAPELPLGHYQPSFSRDGRRIVFVRRAEGPYGELAIADVATGAVRKLTRDGALAWSPVWSADDRHVYFTSSRAGSMNIWKVPARGGEPVRVTAGQGADTDIDLSADGRRLVFASFRFNLDLAEVSLDPAAPGRRWLTNDALRGELAPRYSPDGARIAYFSNRGGAEREGVWVMNSDGTNPVRVVEDDFTNVFPRWSHDGQRLIYASRPQAGFGKGHELREVALAGGAPRDCGAEAWRAWWGGVDAGGRLLFQTGPDSGVVFDPRARTRQVIPGMRGEPAWLADGRSFAYWVRADAADPDEAGLWIGTFDGARRHVFRGWVVSFAVARSGDLYVLQGRPDFRGVLWRVGADGSRTVVLDDVGLYRRETDTGISPVRFDVHPDLRRIAIEAVEILQADIGVIDPVR